MTPTEPRGGENPHAELFQRLDEILVEESPMHPFGCATWMEATKVAIDMAKDALSRPPVVHGWPEREAVARNVNPKAWSKFDRFSGYADHASKVDQIAWSQHLQPSLKTADAILSLFPPVVGWRGIDEHDNSADEVLVMADGWKKPIVAWRHHPSSRTDMWLSVPGRYQVRPTHFAALPAAPLTDGVGE